jgi:2-keto-4-pentenoate hydratase/2-oxohepta-3-ene-1,7-dioic acid hydratase in catechol pathway
MRVDMAKILIVRIIPLLLFIFVIFYFYLNRGLPQEIQPAQFTCLQSDQGSFSQEDIKFKNIYGVGLTYAKHINETAFNFNPDIAPPIFRKLPSSIVKGDSNVAIPAQRDLLKVLEKLEPSISGIIKDNDTTLLPLLDYEAELGFVLLEDITSEDLAGVGFIPKLGFLVANDLSARSIAILGEGQDNRYEYWGASKSYAGFTPVSSQVWVPNHQISDAIPCVTLQTIVDGELRQKENTRNLIFTPKEMLRFIHKKYPLIPMNKGDVILTGTPGGVVMNVPRWKAKLAKLVGLDRFSKLSIYQKKTSADKFLKAGSRVQISAEWVGGTSVTFVNSD